MSETLQHLVVLAIVVAALIVIGRACFRTFGWLPGTNCCGTKSCPRMDELNKRLETPTPARKPPSAPSGRER